MNYSEEYEKLPHGARWMSPDEPMNIGGRDTDIAQIGFSLSEIIKKKYPINGVPEDIVGEILILKTHLKIAEDQIFKIIDMVTVDKNKRGN